MVFYPQVCGEMYGFVYDLFSSDRVWSLDVQPLIVKLSVGWLLGVLGHGIRGTNGESELAAFELFPGFWILFDLFCIFCFLVVVAYLGLVSSPTWMGACVHSGPESSGHSGWRPPGHPAYEGPRRRVQAIGDELRGRQPEGIPTLTGKVEYDWGSDYGENLCDFPVVI